MFGGDESYDREGDGPAGGTARDLAAQDPADLEEPVAAQPAMPPPEPTGDERVDAVMARFAELDGAPVADHVEVFEDVQHRLQDVLAAIDHEDEEASGGQP